jgi:hypothetical protein
MDALIKLISSSGNVWLAIVCICLIKMYQMIKYFLDKVKIDKKNDESFS